jgi:hypothetical protein
MRPDLLFLNCLGEIARKFARERYLKGSPREAYSAIEGLYDY